MSSGTPQAGGGRSDSLSDAARRRLQECFQQASLRMAQENYDYAAELFTTCVAGDPGNTAYVQSFLANLKKKYRDNKKGSALAAVQGMRHIASMKKAAKSQDWPGVIRAGLEMLKLNPWHISTLEEMANACRQMGHNDVRLIYLKMAQEARPTDPAVNKLLAEAYADLGEYDQAIQCWQLVLKAKPNDEEAQKAIAKLTVERTIHRGGYTDPSRAGRKEVPVAPAVTAPAAPSAGEATRAASPEATLLAEIRRDPSNIAKYIQLSEHYIGEGNFDKARDILQRALQVSNNDPDVADRLTDVELRSLRRRIQDLQGKGEAAAGEVAQLEKQLVDKEIELFRRRVERFPGHAAFHFELALRYKQAGRWSEAITEFQKARNDPRHRAACLLELGQCFQAIKQSKLAMQHYAEALKEIGDRDVESQKLGRYLAGKLALEMGDLNTAEEHLTALAAIDFGYRDVSDLLQQITARRESGS
ncbi:MAG: tetratricopeptide repeat protein [Thermoguttaceae bacterium]|nr:tetratricopeptide repeat protein [Thermoguttaceae bacterium]MDW8077402.1 tetratricopeptide repeat protein [Thermoguttaceae bacterium]